MNVLSIIFGFLFLWTVQVNAKNVSGATTSYTPSNNADVKTNWKKSPKQNIPRGYYRKDNSNKNNGVYTNELPKGNTPPASVPSSTVE